MTTTLPAVRDTRTIRARRAAATATITAARTGRRYAERAWANRPRDTTRRAHRDPRTGRIYRDPGLGGVLGLFAIVISLAAIAGVLLAAVAP